MFMLIVRHDTLKENAYWFIWHPLRFFLLIKMVTDSNRCSGIHNVQCDYFDRITFDWHGKRGAKIYIRFNCLSTDFSRIKGVKGIPLRLHIKTQGATSMEHQAQPQPLVEATFCRIKLFRDKVCIFHRHFFLFWLCIMYTPYLFFFVLISKYYYYVLGRWAQE